jgi:transposase-like protein
MYTDQFKRDAVKLVTEQRYSVAAAARNLGIHANLLRTWKLKFEQTSNPNIIRPTVSPYRQSECTDRPVDRWDDPLAVP